MEKKQKIKKKEVKIYFGESLKSFFLNEVFVASLKKIKRSIQKDVAISEILYTKYHTFIFTDDRKSIIITFDVTINNEVGKFKFLITLSDKVISNKIKLNRGLCIIDHPIFNPNLVYSIGCNYDDEDKTLTIKSMKEI